MDSTSKETGHCQYNSICQRKVNERTNEWKHKSISNLFHFTFRISRCLLPLAFNSKWLLVGTYSGNVYVVNLDTFTLSSYKIMWNNAIGMYVTKMSSN